MTPFGPAEGLGLTEARARWLVGHVLPHEPALRRWLASRRLPQIEIDDVVQESYARIVRAGNLNIADNPRAYLFQTAWSVVVTQVRRHKVVAFQALADVEAMGFEAEEPSPEQQVADRDELAKVAQAIASLPKKVGDVFVLRRVHGLSQRETARRLGLAESTVEKHMSRGLLLLVSRFVSGGNPAPEAFKKRSDSVKLGHGSAARQRH